MNRSVRYWPWILLLILALALAGCGGAAAAPSTGGTGAEATSAPGGSASSASGDAVLTPDAAAQQTEVTKGQTVVVKLPTDFNWSLDVTPTIVMSQVKDAQLQPDEQGLFDAKVAGSAVIQAIGKPACAKDSPPCATPQVSYLFKIKVNP